MRVIAIFEKNSVLNFLFLGKDNYICYTKVSSYL